MKVILLEKVQKLGDLGDITNVKPGYARNFLIPQGKAQMATDAAIEAFEARRAELEAEAAKLLAAAEAQAEAMTDMSVTIARPAGDEGKLFGSVGTRCIADALTEAGQSVERRQVRLPEGALRAIGEFDIDVALHTDVTVTIKVVVEAE